MVSRSAWGRLRTEATARPTWGQVDTEMGVLPSSKKVRERFLKSKPKAEGIARDHSYQKPVEMAM